MNTNKPTYDELCDALVSATKSLRAEAEMLQESCMTPDGAYDSEVDRTGVEEAFAEVNRYRAILRRAGRELDSS